MISYFVRIWRNAIFKLKWEGKIQFLVPWVPQIPSYISRKPLLFAKASFCSDLSQYAMISQTLINADIFPFRTGPDILIKVFGDNIIFLIRTAWVCLIFILSKKKKKNSVWRFTENTCYIFFHEETGTVTQIHERNVGLNQETSSITRLFSSFDIYYNQSLNTDLQKQKET